MPGSSAGDSASEDSSVRSVGWSGSGSDSLDGVRGDLGSDFSACDDDAADGADGPVDDDSADGFAAFDDASADDSDGELADDAPVSEGSAAATP